MFINVIYEPILVLAHREEVVLLPDKLWFTHMNRALIVYQFGICIKPLTSDTVFSLIVTEIYIPFCINLREDFPDCVLMVLIGGAHKIVIGNIELGPGILKGFTDPVHVCPDCLTRFFSCLYYLVTMFIGAG